MCPASGRYSIQFTCFTSTIYLLYSRPLEGARKEGVSGFWKVLSLLFLLALLVHYLLYSRPLEGARKEGVSGFWKVLNLLALLVQKYKY